MDMKNLFAEAQKIIPGGVNSPVRAFRSVGGTPRFIREAAGAKVIDAEGREYIDYVASWGPMILGHSHPEVVAAIREAAGRGTSYGAPTESEIGMAERIVAAFPVHRDGPDGELRNRGDHDRHPPRPRLLPEGRRSSSSPAAITAMPIRSS